jgi:hypothetical protein
MSKTSAERQAAYRASRRTAGADGNGERRLNTWVNTETYLALRRLSKRYGVTQRELLERLVNREDDGVLASLDIDTPEWNTYFAIGRGVSS